MTEQPPFTGIYPAVLTPMHADLSCNEEALAGHCNDLMRRGCSGIVLFGTTGEGPSFSVEERKKVIRALIRLGIDPQKLIIGISSSAIDDVVRLAKAAVEDKCLGVLLAPPFFYKNVDERGVIAFYREVIRRVDSDELKMLLYHIPQHSEVPLTFNIVSKLREEFPSCVVGIKESEGNLPLAKEILTACPGFKVFAGRDLLISGLVQLGAVGGISGLANAYPELICSLYEHGKDQQKPNPHETVKGITQLLKNYPIIAAIKTVVEAERGHGWHTMRPPLVPLDQNQSQELIQALKQYGS